jgi:hypothetical protein
MRVAFAGKGFNLEFLQWKGCYNQWERRMIGGGLKAF